MAPAPGPGVVVVINDGGLVEVLEAATGRARWTTTLRTPAAGGPLLVGDRLVLSEQGREEDLTQHDHRVTVNDLSTGRWLGSYEPAGSSFAVGAFGASGTGAILVPVTVIRPLLMVLTLEGP